MVTGLIQTSQMVEKWILLMKLEWMRDVIVVTCFVFARNCGILCAVGVLYDALIDGFGASRGATAW